MARIEQGDFLEHVKYVSGKRYGTLRSEMQRVADDGRVCVLELELDGALRVQEDVPGSVTLFIAAPVEELERRLRERATESTGEIGDRIALARDQLEQAHQVPLHGAERRRRARDGLALRDRRAGARVRSYHGPLMIEPRIDDLLEHVDSRYALVIVAAKRARQINSYHHQLGEGMGFDVAPPPLIESRSKNYLTMAMEEVAQAKIAYAYPKP